MKVDGLGVVLAIILLPIILVVTYYIQMQVDTIAMQNEYNTKLLSATYDAMSAFELNTANEELSSVADSMRSIVLASNNVFFDALANNMGISNASKEYIRPYIPAVLYTMYDGYYIYAPTETAKVAEKKEEAGNEDEEKIITTKGYLSVGETGVVYSGVENLYNYNPGENPTFKDDDYSDYGLILYEDTNEETDYLTTDKSKAKMETDYLLKSYMQYSARYKKDTTKDVTINYTLDNYLNIVGTIGDTYYTKTGYLIKNGLVNDAKINGTSYDLTTNNETDAQNKILGLKTNVQETTIKAAEQVSVEIKIETNSQTIEANWSNITMALENMEYENVTTISEAETYLKKAYEENKNLSEIQNLEYEIGKYKAIAYYVSSAIFSNWVYDNLSDLTYDHIEDTAMRNYVEGIYNTTSGVGEDDLYYNFHNITVKNTQIFDKSQDPEDSESNFNTHKMEVIKNSIKYNLNLSISAYCKMNDSYEFSLPILLDEEWDKILSNLSIVSFMQGLDCGLNIYNNYQIVSSTNNELTVTPSEIYYVKKDEFNNGSGTYHRIDCPYLEEYSNGYISFKSKEVKFDKIYDKSTSKYQYDHRNLACYTCINNNNYNGLFSKDSASYYDRINSLKKSSESENADSEAKKLAGYIALAKERQEIYKTNALPVSEGYKIINENVHVTNGNTIDVEDCEANTVKKLQITISNTVSRLPNQQTTREPIAQLNITVGGKKFENQAINLDQTKAQTINLDMTDATQKITNIIFEKVSPEVAGYTIEYDIKSIKAIYK